MKYLFLEIWFFLLLAFLLGMFVQWFFCCRNKKEDVAITAAPIASTETVTAEVEEKVAVDDSWKPLGLSSRPVDADELKRIKGIGAVIEKTLNELGIYKFEQIADWSSDNVAWVENFLAFPGRIDREDWINQANTLSSGGTTEFAKRVDKGDVNYDS